jgi:serine protease inhibitor
MNAFGFEMLGSGAAGAGNAVFSPTSIVLALAMARAGAVGETAAQMDTVLHSAWSAGGGNGINSLEQALTALSGTYRDAGGKEQTIELRIANAPFAQRGMALEQPYLDALSSRFDAGLRLCDFAGDAAGATRTINGWVSDQTKGRIPSLLDSLDSLTRLVLVNAIYMKAPWETPFEPTATKNAPFTKAGGSTVEAATMSGSIEGAGYAEGTDWKAVALPYGKGSLEMLVVVPDNLASFEAGLDAARFDGIADALDRTTVQLTMPRFKAETKLDLAKTLAAMGMPRAFDPDRADFSAITTAERLFISAVIHQANISVDEKGTEASAATAVVMKASAMPRVVSLAVDRPFLFAVRDTDSGGVLFLGRIVDPAA